MAFLKAGLPYIKMHFLTKANLLLNSEEKYGLSLGKTKFKG